MRRRDGPPAVTLASSASIGGRAGVAPGLRIVTASSGRTSSRRTRGNFFLGDGVEEYATALTRWKLPRLDSSKTPTRNRATTSARVLPPSAGGSRTFRVPSASMRPIAYKRSDWSQSRDANGRRQQAVRRRPQRRADLAIRPDDHCNFPRSGSIRAQVGDVLGDEILHAVYSSRLHWAIPRNSARFVPRIDRRLLRRCSPKSRWRHCLQKARCRRSLTASGNGLQGRNLRTTRIRSSHFQNGRRIEGHPVDNDGCLS